MDKLVEKLQWDSEFFSFGIGKLTTTALDETNAEEAIEQGRRLDLRCLYFDADPGDSTTILIAEKNGFHLADVRVVLEYVFDNGPRTFSGTNISSGLVLNEATESDIPRLEEIAVEISRVSRYSYDPHFSVSDVERLYRAWIRNSIHGFADKVFVTRLGSENAEPVGLLTCSVKEGTGHLFLIGVHHESHRKGIGSILVDACLDWTHSQGVARTQVVTQGRNIPAQRTFLDRGFRTKSMSLFYHIWL